MYYELASTIDNLDFNNFDKLVLKFGLDHMSSETEMNILHYLLYSSDISENDRLVFLNKILDFGIDVNAKDEDGFTALHYAISISPQVVSILLEKGANVSLGDNKGNSPLMHAVKEFRGEAELLKIIKLVIEFGADPDKKNIFDKSPRMIVQNMHESMANTKKPKEWDLQPHLNW